MTIVEWMPIIKTLGFNLAACTVLDGGLLWTGGLWLDTSYLESPEKVDRILSLFTKRPGLLPTDRDKAGVTILSSKTRSPTRLLQLKKKGQLLAEKWDIPLSPEEEVPIAEWCRLLNHGQKTGWIEVNHPTTARINQLYISFQAFCPTPPVGDPGWKQVYFTSQGAILRDQEDTAEMRAAKEANVYLTLCSTFASHMEKGKVGMISYEPDEHGNQKKTVTVTRASRVRLSKE